MLSLIVAISENNAIGKAGDLLCHLPNDLKHFKELTTGATVVMGKKTFFSLPRRPLPNRRNIVLTRDTAFAYDNTEVAHSIQELQTMLQTDEHVFIIGGETIYKQFLPYCDVAHVTWIDYEYLADTHFPNLDKDPEWHVTAVSDEQTYFDLCYEYRQYERK